MWSGLSVARCGYINKHAFAFCLLGDGRVHTLPAKYGNDKDNICARQANKYTPTSEAAPVHRLSRKWLPLRRAQDVET